MSTDVALTVPRVGQVTIAGRVRPGDAVLDGGRFVVIDRVRRAQGRKPAQGENLHLLVAGTDDALKRNSLEPVRVRRAGT